MLVGKPLRGVVVGRGILATALGRVDMYGTQVRFKSKTMG